MLEDIGPCGSRLKFDLLGHGLSETVPVATVNTPPAEIPSLFNALAGRFGPDSDYAAGDVLSVTETRKIMLTRRKETRLIWTDTATQSARTQPVSIRKNYQDLRSAQRSKAELRLRVKDHTQDPQQYTYTCIKAHT